MIHPDDSMDSSESSGDVSVALDTLATGDGTMPEVGDEVDVQVTGTISRIESEHNCAYVTPVTLNGEPPPDKGNKESPEDSMMRQAQKADDEAGY